MLLFYVDDTWIMVCLHKSIDKILTVIVIVICTLLFDHSPIHICSSQTHSPMLVEDDLVQLSFLHRLHTKVQLENSWFDICLVCNQDQDVLDDRELKNAIHSIYFLSPKISL